MVMGGSVIANGANITTQDFVGDTVMTGQDTLKCTSPATVTIIGKDIKFEEIEKVKFLLDGNPIYIFIESNTRWDIENKETGEIVLKTKTGYYYRTSRVLQGDKGTEITLKGTTEIITQGTIIEKYTSSLCAIS